MRRLAEALAAHPDFQNLVTLADTDSVPIEVVLNDTREFYTAARLGRLLVTNQRHRDAEAGVHPDDTDPADPDPDAQPGAV